MGYDYSLKKLQFLLNRLDSLDVSNNKFEIVFNPIANELREKLKEISLFLLYSSSFQKYKEIELLIWRKVYYEPIHIMKKNLKQPCKSDISSLAQLLCDLNLPDLDISDHSSNIFLIMGYIQSGIAYYHQILNILQIDFSGINFYGKVDLALDKRINHFIDNNIDNSKCHSIVYQTLIYLGDLARYYSDIELAMIGNKSLSLPSSCFGITLAQRYYHQAIILSPELGMPNSQLGTLLNLKYQGLSSIFHYMACTLSNQSFEGAHSNLKRVFDRVRVLYHESVDDQDLKYSEKISGDSNEQTLKLKSKLNDHSFFLIEFIYLMDVFYNEDLNIDVPTIQNLCQSVLTRFSFLLEHYTTPTNNNEIDSALDSDPHHLNYPAILQMTALCYMIISILQNTGSKNLNLAVAFTIGFCTYVLNRTVVNLQTATRLVMDRESDKLTCAITLLNKKHDAETELKSKHEFSNSSKNSQHSIDTKDRTVSLPNVTYPTDDEILENEQRLRSQEDVTYKKRSRCLIGTYRTYNDDVNDKLFNSQIDKLEEARDLRTQGHDDNLDSANSLRSLSPAPRFLRRTRRSYRDDKKFGRMESLNDTFSDESDRSFGNRSDSDVDQSAHDNHPRIMKRDHKNSSGMDSQNEFFIEIGQPKTEDSENQLHSNSNKSHGNSYEKFDGNKSILQGTSDSISITDGKRTESYLAELDELKLASQKMTILALVNEVLQPETLLPVLKIFCAWLESHNEILYMCAKSCQSMWGSFVSLFNCLPNENLVRDLECFDKLEEYLYFNYATLWNLPASSATHLIDKQGPPSTKGRERQALNLSVDYFEIFAQNFCQGKRNFIALTEDIYFYGFMPLAAAQSHMLFNPKAFPTISDIFQTLIRTFQLRRFGTFLSQTKEIDVLYDTETDQYFNTFTIADKELRTQNIKAMVAQQSNIITRERIQQKSESIDTQKRTKKREKRVSSKGVITIPKPLSEEPRPDSPEFYGIGLAENKKKTEQLMRLMGHLRLKCQSNAGILQSNNETGDGKVIEKMKQPQTINDENGVADPNLRYEIPPPYLLPDTHVLCEKLHLIKILLASCSFIIILSRSVLDLLDILKKENGKARRVIRWIEVEMRDGNKFLHVQYENEQDIDMNFGRHLDDRDKRIRLMCDMLRCAHFFALKVVTIDNGDANDTLPSKMHHNNDLLESKNSQKRKEGEAKSFINKPNNENIPKTKVYALILTYELPNRLVERFCRPHVSRIIQGVNMMEVNDFYELWKRYNRAIGQQYLVEPINWEMHYLIPLPNLPSPNNKLLSHKNERHHRGRNRMRDRKKGTTLSNEANRIKSPIEKNTQNNEDDFPALFKHHIKSYEEKPFIAASSAGKFREESSYAVFDLQSIEKEILGGREPKNMEQISHSGSNIDHQIKTSTPTFYKGSNTKLDFMSNADKPISSSFSGLYPPENTNKNTFLNVLQKRFDNYKSLKLSNEYIHNKRSPHLLRHPKNIMSPKNTTINKNLTPIRIAQRSHRVADQNLELSGLDRDDIFNKVGNYSTYRRHISEAINDSDDASISSRRDSFTAKILLGQHTEKSFIKKVGGFKAIDDLPQTVRHLGGHAFATRFSRLRRQGMPVKAVSGVRLDTLPAKSAGPSNQRRFSGRPTVARRSLTFHVSGHVSDGNQSI